MLRRAGTKGKRTALVRRALRAIRSMLRQSRIVTWACGASQNERAHTDILREHRARAPGQTCADAVTLPHCMPGSMD